jgi:hypothetical protein
MSVLTFKNHIIYSNVGSVIIETQSRSDYVYPYQYSGIANVGVLESDNGWTINRIDFTTPGSPITLSAIGPWDDRITLSYS